MRPLNLFLVDVVCWWLWWWITHKFLGLFILTSSSLISFVLSSCIFLLCPVHFDGARQSAESFVRPAPSCLWPLLPPSDKLPPALSQEEHQRPGHSHGRPPQERQRATGEQSSHFLFKKNWGLWCSANFPVPSKIRTSLIWLWWRMLWACIHVIAPMVTLGNYFIWQGH